MLDSSSSSSDSTSPLATGSSMCRGSGVLLCWGLLRMLLVLLSISDSCKVHQVLLQALLIPAAGCGQVCRQTLAVQARSEHVLALAGTLCWDCVLLGRSNSRLCLTRDPQSACQRSSFPI